MSNKNLNDNNYISIEKQIDRYIMKRKKSKLNINDIEILIADFYDFFF